MCARRWVILAAALAGLGVTAGAWAAHGLDRYCQQKFAAQPARSLAGLTVPAAFRYWQDFRTGVRYQMYHAFALLVVGLLAARGPNRLLQAAGWLFLIGVVLFSGSLYALVLTGAKWWGAVTPVGGLSFLGGWLLLALSQWPRPPAGAD